MKTFNPHVSKFKVIDIMTISSYIIKMAVVLCAQWDYSKRTITLNSLLKYEPTVHHDWAHPWIKSFKQVYFVILHSFFIFPPLFVSQSAAAATIRYDSALKWCKLHQDAAALILMAKLSTAGACLPTQRPASSSSNNK